MNRPITDYIPSGDVQRIIKDHADEFVEMAYLGVLGRSADPDGLKAAEKNLKEHGLLSRTLSNFANSDEHLLQLRSKFESKARFEES